MCLYVFQLYTNKTTMNQYIMQIVYCLSVFLKYDDNEQLILTHQTGLCGKGTPQNIFICYTWIAGMVFFGHKTYIKMKHMLCFIQKYKNYVWERTLKHFFEYSQEPKTRGYQFLAVHFIQECN